MQVEQYISDEAADKAGATGLLPSGLYDSKANPDILTRTVFNNPLLTDQRLLYPERDDLPEKTLWPGT